jgi:hypothetical protein
VELSNIKIRKGGIAPCSTPAPPRPGSPRCPISTQLERSHHLLNCESRFGEVCETSPSCPHSLPGRSRLCFESGLAWFFNFEPTNSGRPKSFRLSKAAASHHLRSPSVAECSAAPQAQVVPPPGAVAAREVTWRSQALSSLLFRTFTVSVGATPPFPAHVWLFTKRPSAQPLFSPSSVRAPVLNTRSQYLQHRSVG